MPVQLIIVAIVAVAGAFGVYQIRVSVQSVSEIFTNKESALNSVALQVIIGVVATYIVYLTVKGK